MNDSVVQLQPAFILRHKKYRETSLIFEVLTKEFGIVSILAKGVRKKKSKWAGLLLPFSFLKLSYVGKNDLKTLTHVELDSINHPLKGLSLYCGFYINELVFFFLYKYDPHPEIFTEYQRCLILLSHSSVEVEQTLRFFELNMIECLGYGVQLNYDAKLATLVKERAMYLFSPEFGMIEHSKGYICGSSLLALGERRDLNKQALYESKQLMRRIIDFQLKGKKLKSRQVLAQIIKQL